ncbi:MAG: hypothetical protein K6B52_03525 [Clostridiales bacterium]|nr:hypothetical protein [Clostridiales bacterium]
MQNNDNVREIDLVIILKTLVKKIWLIILSAVVCGSLFFSLVYVAVDPTYTADIELYVNNTDISVGNASFNISSSTLNAAQQLVNTYIVILNSRTTLNEVIEYAGVNIKPERLKSMITAKAVDSTEIFKINVETTDPALSTVLANAIAKVLPNRIAEIVDGSSVRVVDYAVTPSRRSGPAYTRITVIGVLIGILCSTVTVIVRAVMDNVIHEEAYLSQAYDIPVLASIPDSRETKGSRYYYYSHGKNS